MVWKLTWTWDTMSVSSTLTWTSIQTWRQVVFTLKFWPRNVVVIMMVQLYKLFHTSRMHWRKRWCAPLKQRMLTSWLLKLVERLVILNHCHSSKHCVKWSAKLVLKTSHTSTRHWFHTCVLQEKWRRSQRNTQLLSCVHWEFNLTCWLFVLSNQLRQRCVRSWHCSRTLRQKQLLSLWTLTSCTKLLWTCKSKAWTMLSWSVWAWRLNQLTWLNGQPWLKRSATWRRSWRLRWLENMLICKMPTFQLTKHCVPVVTRLTLM